jgi:beta-phosphoglucomutase-like phosphatase (HAD superfamily)
MDGLLVDTEPTWDEVRRGLAAEDGVPWPAEATHAMMGMSTPEWAAYLVTEVGLRCTADEAARRTIEGLERRYRSELAIREDAVGAVGRMAGLAPVGVASSSPRRLIEAVLDSMGVAGLFSAVVSTEEVAAGKPAPDGYIEACRRLGADPALSIGVEDSSSGIRSVKAAGMVVIAVPDPFTQSAPETLDLADAVLGSLADLDEALVTALITVRSRSL